MCVYYSYQMYCYCKSLQIKANIMYVVKTHLLSSAESLCLATVGVAFESQS